MSVAQLSDLHMTIYVAEEQGLTRERVWGKMRTGEGMLSLAILPVVLPSTSEAGGLAGSSELTSESSEWLTSSLLLAVDPCSSLACRNKYSALNNPFHPNKFALPTFEFHHQNRSNAL